MNPRTKSSQAKLPIESGAKLADGRSNKQAAATSFGPHGPAANVTAERLVDAANEPGQWMSYRGTYSEQRFSALKQIDASNVNTLGLRWFADYETTQDQHGSPLYIDGVIYVSTARNVVHAFDAKTGKQLIKKAMSGRPTNYEGGTTAIVAIVVDTATSPSVPQSCHLGCQMV